ncbi:MAG TPA: hypothetical protein VIM97_15085, partial [Actinomycetes bacterium]
MARPKRMGAYNALDDLLPGPAWDAGPAWDPDAPDPGGEPAPPPRRPRLEPVPDPAWPARRRQGLRGAIALDDLLPGPSVPPARRLEAARSRPSAGGGETPAGRSAGRAGRHLGVWNPLDGPPPARPAPAPVPAPAKARVSFRLPADLVETARDTVAHLAGTADRTTLTALTERALRVELARLAITHNHG